MSFGDLISQPGSAEHQSEVQVAGRVERFESSVMTRTARVAHGASSIARVRLLEHLVAPFDRLGQARHIGKLLVVIRSTA